MLLAAEGVLPVERRELLGLQVLLSRSSDPEISDKARQALAEIEPDLLASIVPGADAAVLEALVAATAHPRVIEEVLGRPELEADLLCALAARIPQELQEVLLLRQEDIRQHPRILDALEENPQLSAYSERLIREYREYLLPRREAAKPPAPEELDEITEEVVQEAIEVVGRHVARIGEYDESTGLSENQIRSLPIAIRIKLAFGASKALRNILLRDPSPHVSLTALNRSAISEREIEQLCRSRGISDEVLMEISRHREWIRKYRILHALVQNPRTPVSLSMQLLPRLAVRDLKVMSVNRNVPDAVRARSRLLYRQKVV